MKLLGCSDQLQVLNDTGFDSGLELAKSNLSARDLVAIEQRIDKVTDEQIESMREKK